MVKISSCFL